MSHHQQNIVGFAVNIMAEPKWVHGKRAIVEPDRVLSAPEVMDRVYAYYGCVAEVHLAISEKAA